MGLAAAVIVVVLGLGAFLFSREPLDPEKLKAQEVLVAEGLSVETLLQDKEQMEIAKTNFESKCSQCHGKNGEGRVGPNLTDDYWIHSKGDFEGISTAIEKGFPQKGMQGWEGKMYPLDLKYLAAYVLTLQDSPVEGGKGPQGEKIPKSQ